MEKDKIILSEFCLNDNRLTKILEGYLSKKTIGWQHKLHSF